MEQKKKRMYGALWLWCVGQGYEEVPSPQRKGMDAAFIKGEKTIGFIFECNKTHEQLLFCIKKAKEQVDLVYVATNDWERAKELCKVLPEFCGIFCHANPFGLGIVTQVLREAKLQ